MVAYMDAHLTSARGTQVGAQMGAWNKAVPTQLPQAL